MIRKELLIGVMSVKALLFTRIFTLMVSCSMYLSLVKDDNWFEYLFIALGAAVYAANHFLLKTEKYDVWFCLIDLTVGFSFGFMFPGNGLFIIMLCPVAVAFFCAGSIEKWHGFCYVFAQFCFQLSSYVHIC